MAKITRSLQDAPADQGLVDECFDEITEFVDTLDYSPEVIAYALSTHLAGLLRALLDFGQCSPQEIEEFFRRMQEEALAS